MNKHILIWAVMGLSLVSCKKFVDPGLPQTGLTMEQVFHSDANATSAQLSIYARMERDAFVYYLVKMTGLSSDELVNHSSTPYDIDLANNDLKPDNPVVHLVWNMLYKYIYQANAIIGGVQESRHLSEPVKRQLKGEALFVHAFCHYNLLQLFGDVPLITTTNYEVNAVAARQPIDAVLSYIVTELREASVLLDMSYRDGKNALTTERVRPNAAAAAALLARVYMLQGNWLEAERYSTIIINENSYQLSRDPEQVFLRSGQEAIWQLMSVVPGYDSYSAAFLLFNDAPHDISVQPSLVNIFHPEDKRRHQWFSIQTDGTTTTCLPYKYRVTRTVGETREYTTMLRLSEIYLVRACARSQLNNLSGAESDLNKIRERAGLSAVTGLTKIALTDSIILERRRELFCESGDRWFELKRTNAANQVLSLFKGNTWQETDQLYPVPQAEILRNPRLWQNPGY